ncbi:MAG TPA: proline dehydrogenase family protein, partial [Tepidisphaeraceae bacterium]
MRKLDDRILEIGGEIFARVRALTASPSPLARIDDAFMDLSMRDEVVKGQLFRFVDVLPTLGTSAAVSGHLREYLEPIADRLPGPLRLAIREGILSPVVAAAANFNVRRMARKFISAPDLDHTVKAIGRLRNMRLAFTVDLLGEAVISENEADQYQQKYLELARHLPGRLAKFAEDGLIDRDADGVIPRANISLKLSALYSQFDPLNPVGTMEAVSRRLREILRIARANGAFVNLDMEQFSFKELTIQIFKSILMEKEFRDWRDVGIAMQAYLRCTLEDLKSLAEWAAQRGTSVTVRLVKGAYWDFETVVAAQNGWPVPVFTDKAETDANFESCA